MTQNYFQAYFFLTSNSEHVARNFICLGPFPHWQNTKTLGKVDWTVLKVNVPNTSLWWMNDYSFMIHLASVCLVLYNQDVRWYFHVPWDLHKIKSKSRFQMLWKSKPIFHNFCKILEELFVSGDPLTLTLACPADILSYHFITTPMDLNVKLNSSLHFPIYKGKGEGNVNFTTYLKRMQRIQTEI